MAKTSQGKLKVEIFGQDMSLLNIGNGLNTFQYWCKPK